MTLTLMVVAALASGELPARGARSAAVVSVVWPGAVAPEQGDHIEALVRTSLLGAEVPLTSVVAAMRARDKAQKCGAKLDCIANLGFELKADLVVRVEPAAVSRDIAVLVQAIDAAGATVVAEANLSVPAASLDAELPKQLAPLVAKVKAYLLKAASPVAVAAVVPKPEFVPVPVPAVVAPPAAPPMVTTAGPLVPRTVSLVVAGVGGVVAIAGGVRFATAGKVQKDANGNVFQSDAELVPDIRRRQTLGVGLAAAGGVIAIAGVTLWALTPRETPVVVTVGLSSVTVAGRF